MPSNYFPLSPTYGYSEASQPFDHRIPTSSIRTSPSLSSSASSSSSSSSHSSSSPGAPTPSYSISSSSSSKRKYDPVHFEVEVKRKREEEEESVARRPSSSSSRSSNDGDWKPSSRHSEVGMLTEKELARKERRKAVNRASAAAFRLRKKLLLEKQKAILEEKDSIASLLRAQAASMLEENEKLRAQLRESTTDQD